METVPFRKKVTRHFKRYRGRYMTGGVCLVVGSIVGIYAAKRKQPIIVNDNDDITNSLNMISRIVGRNGHPGNIIYCNETKQVFKSHREASRELGIDNRDLWAYLKGIKPTARGFTFKKIGEANR